MPDSCSAATLFCKGGGENIFFDEAAPPPNFRRVKKQTAHLLSQMGGCIANRHHGGITPEAELLWL